MEKINLILYPVGCRSDEGLSAPVIKRLKADPYFEIRIVQLAPARFEESYNRVKIFCNSLKPTAIFCMGDRIEMTAAACAAFHCKIPIIHFGSGITNQPLSTLDDVNRHCICLWSDLIFCENRRAYFTSWKLWDAIHKSNGFEAHIVGTTHMDDIEIDESLVPDEPYDLILINPTTRYKEVQHVESDIKTIKIGPNPDPKDVFKDPTWTIWHPDYHNLPRPQFMGLLKNCRRFLTNSSSAYYEAPYFLKPEQIIVIGSRNAQRSSDYTDMQQGASDRIVDIMKKWCEKRKKLK